MGTTFWYFFQIPRRAPRTAIRLSVMKKDPWFNPQKLGCLQSLLALLGLFAMTAVIGWCGHGVSSVFSSAPPAARTAEMMADGAARVADRAEVDPAPTPSAAARPALRGSRAAFRAAFHKLDMTFESSPLADGTPREMARENGLAVESIGAGDALERATLIFGLAKDDVSGALKATGAMMVFMRETGWEPGYRWVTSNLQTESATTKRSGVEYRLVRIMPGAFTLTAKPMGVAD